MPLKSDEVNNLLKVLSTELTEGQTLETIANTYHSLLPSAELFHVCSALSFMLQNLEEYAQPCPKRLVSCFLIYECYKNQPIKSNPFVSVLLEFYTNKESTKVIQRKEIYEREKHFLHVLLLEESSKKDLIKLTPKQILHSDVVQTFILDPLLYRLGGKALEINPKQFEQNIPELCKDLAISTILPYPDDKSWIIGDSSQKVQQMLKELLCNPESAIDQHFLPQMISLNPPTHYNENEFYFCFPSELQRLEFLWDATTTADKEVGSVIGSDDESKCNVQQLLSIAYQRPLNLRQKNSCITQLSQNPSFIFDSELNPQKFSDLVEHNPLVAIEVLRALKRSDKFTEYLTVLVNMEMSVPSMEVLKQLTAEVDLPSDIIVPYLCNCMSTCEQIKDQYTQSRLVRLFCVFLQSLLINKTINVEDIAIEVQCFCIQFSGVKEASALYRMLKSACQTDGEATASSNLSVDCNAKESTSSNSDLSSPSG